MSIYYCYRSDGQTLDCIVTEITNTPWKERHSYVLDVAAAHRDGEALRWDFGKAFHGFTLPADAARLRLAFHPARRAACMCTWDVNDADEKDFDATLVLERRPADGRTLARCLLRYPAMTLKVLARHPLAGFPDVAGGQSGL